MNKIYRLVFNRNLGVMQVASELTGSAASPSRGAGTRPRLAMALLATCLLLGMAPSAWAVNDPDQAALLDGDSVINPDTAADFDLQRIDTWGMIVGYQGNGHLIVNDGFELDSTGVTLGFAPGITGQLDIVGAGSTLDAGGFFNNPGGFYSGNALEVGYAGTGILNVLDGGVATEINDMSIGTQAGSEGTVNVDGPGSQLLARYAQVGWGGEGTFNITNGGKASFTGDDTVTTAVDVGRDAGSKGTVLVDGTDSLLEITGDPLVVGHLGTGLLTVSNGGTVTAQGGTSIGSGGTGIGRVEVTGADSTLSAAYLTIGRAGQGDLVVGDGARVEATDDDRTLTWMTLGDQEDGVGNVLIEGKGTTFDAKTGNSTVIGEAGKGTLTVKDGASATLGYVLLGYQAGATGNLQVTGAGTTLTSNGEIDVGGSGIGTMDVLDGASAAAETIGIGVEFYGTGSERSPGTNALHVGGKGSSLSVADALSMAVNGDASALVDGGANVKVGTVNLEFYELSGSGLFSSGHNGQLDISGAGTSFESTGEFVVSPHLVLSDGAALKTGSAMVMTSASSTGSDRAQVTGKGTTWTNAGKFFLNTQLDIADGAVLKTGTLEIGGSSFADSTSGPLSELRVSGAGSRVETTGSAFLGSNSYYSDHNTVGYLVLTDGGQLKAGDDVVLGASGGLALGAGITGKSGDSSLYADAAAPGSVNGDARLVFQDDDSNDKLLLNHTSDDLVLSNTMLSEGYATADRSGGGITSVAGTTRLTGDMSQYASRIDVLGGKLVLDSDINVEPDDHNPNQDGSTSNKQEVTVSGGKLIVNGNLGFEFLPFPYSPSMYGTTTLTATSGGVLGGKGTIFGTVAASDGAHIAPGDGNVATLGIHGDLSFASGAFYDVDIKANGKSDKLAVSGTAWLDSNGDASTVQVNALDPGGNYQDGQTYTILTADAGVFGTFAKAITKSAFLDPSLSYDANNVLLKIALDTQQLPVVVDDGEVFDGAGTWLSLDVRKGGTVSPGTGDSPIGTMDFTKSVDFAAGSFYDVDIKGDGSSDLIQTGGTAQLDGGTVQVTALDPETSYQDGQQYTILSADSGLTGTFEDVLSKSAFLDPTLSYDANNVLLTIALKTTVDDNGIVDDGEVLQGNGSYDTIDVRAGGTVSPGTSSNPIDTVKSAGDVTFANGSFYDVDIRGDGSSDLIEAAGKAQLDGGTVNVTALDPKASYQDGQQYTILSADGGLTGTFQQALSRSAFLMPSLSYTDTQALLKIALKDNTGPSPGGPPIFETVAQTRNQYNVAVALDTLPQKGDALALYNRLLMLSADEARSAYGNLSGEVHAATRTGLLDDRFMQQGVQRRMTGAVAGEDHDGIGAWIAGDAASGEIGSDGNGARSTSQRSGVMAGADFAVGSHVALGVAAGAENIDRRMRSWGSAANSNATHLAVYATANWGAFSLNGGASHAWYDVDTTRHVAVDAGPAERVTSSHDARATTFFAEGGWNFDLGTTQLTPYIGVAHTRLRSDGTTEHGGGTALRVAGSKDELLTATAGMRASWNLDGGRADDPRLTTGLAWQNASGELKQEQRAGLVVGGSDFTVYAAPLARNMGVADVGLSLRTSDASRLLVGMQARFGSGQHDVGGQVNWAWKF